MKYISTRGESTSTHASEVIRLGLAPDGGLFVPDQIPRFSSESIAAMAQMSYTQIAADILHLYLDDFTRQEIDEIVTVAYSEEKFGECPTPLVQLNKYNDREYILELWHGPTAAFKDIALQTLPNLMTESLRKADETSNVCIVVATSGDTGKAAMEGFRDIEGTKVVVFYPEEGVSTMQRMQMVTQEGENCFVVAVKGSFDDVQTGVKNLFDDMKADPNPENIGVYLSSANSINWGRLSPQIVYYFYAYSRLLKTEKILPGEPINFVVPTGNFGNILAGYYALKMGLPVHKLICASNQNKVLSDFLRNGTYDINRPFYKTNSPSMDILISGNLERLLFEISGRDSARIVGWMSALKAEKSYTVDPITLRRIQEVFVGGFADETGTLKTIREIYDRCDHCVDTHTAVGFNVYERYYTRSKDESKTVFISTASPFKFPGDVCDALFGRGYRNGRNDEVLLKELSEETDLEIPESIRSLSEKNILHRTVVEKTGMKAALFDFLKREY
jgi:threonine synthase